MSNKVTEKPMQPAPVLFKDLEPGALYKNAPMSSEIIMKARVTYIIEKHNGDGLGISLSDGFIYSVPNDTKCWPVQGIEIERKA